MMHERAAAVGELEVKHGFEIQRGEAVDANVMVTESERTT